MKVTIFGFGMTPLFIKPLIEKVNKEKNKFDFSLILSSSHHLKLMNNLVGQEKVICTDRQLPKFKNTLFESSILSNYPDNIFKNIESQKVTMKNRDSNTQKNIAFATYTIIKDFLIKIKPNYILYIQSPEDMEGMIIGGLCKELKIPLAVPHHTRYIGRSFFNSHRQELLPKGEMVKDIDIEKATKFLINFNGGKTSADYCELSTINNLHYIPYKKSPKIKRLVDGIKRFYLESRSRELNTLRISLLNNWFPIWRDFYRGTRVLLNRRLFNCALIENLPKKFIFYPIQYSPESSINIPSPYLIDQLRVIDAIRMSMPSDYLLLVKEHPSCITVRPRKFMKTLLNKAGVEVAKVDMDTQLIIKKSRLVISVTGTAALEAFLQKKPSLVLGPTFFSDYIGGVCKLSDLQGRIIESLKKTINNKEVIKFLSEVYNVSSNFISGTPGDVRNDFMMTYENLDSFWSAFLEHSKRTKE